MKRKSLSRFLLVFLLASAFSACASQSDAETAITKETIPTAELIKQADELYAQREDLAKLRDAVAKIERARNADPKNFEAMWKLARMKYFLGKYTTDDKEAEKAFKDGIAAAESASILEKGKPEGYFWKGANLGGRAKKSPLTYGISSVGEIQEQMNKVIAIDPAYQNASAYDALAQIELATGMTGGKPEKALEYLEKGIAIDKENSYLRLHLAETYLALNRPNDAKKQIDFLMKIKPNPEFLPEYKDSVEEAKKLLETRF